MSTRSNQPKQRKIPHKSQTQRKINNKKSNINNNLLVKQNKPILGKKNYSMKSNTSNLMNLQSINLMHFKQKKHINFLDQNTKLQCQDLKIKKNNKQMNIILKDVHKFLKVKRKSARVQSKHIWIMELNKYNNLKSKFKKQNNKKKQFIDYHLQAYEKNRKKPALSLYLQSTNFQEASLCQAQSKQRENIDSQTIISQKKLIKQKQFQHARIPIRNKIKSCRFVVNPFENIKSKGKKKIKFGFSSNLKAKISSQQFLHMMELNQISTVQHLFCTHKSFLHSQSTQILQILQI